jgi:hypothetical protein
MAKKTKKGLCIKNSSEYAFIFNEVYEVSDEADIEVVKADRNGVLKSEMKSLASILSDKGIFDFSREKAFDKDELFEKFQIIQPPVTIIVNRQ